MPFSFRSFLVVVFILFLFVQAAAPRCPAADSPAAPGAYDQALRQAEEELRRLDVEQEESGGWGVGEALSVAALLAALALMLLAMRWSRGTFRRASGREMRLLDRMALSRNTSLLLVRVRGRDYWLAEGQSAITLLADWPVPEAKGGSEAGAEKRETPST